uniref:RING-type domain-containing protein n=1 Tax=Panagrolaimus superbus TaxID=310955 RepID=A0A914Y167_9BILA
MSWVHCNKCFAEPNENGVKGTFFLTSCSHISCQKCYESSRNVCHTCKKQNIKVLRIDSSLNKQYRQYFVDISRVIASKMEEMGKIRKFQDIQIQNLVKGTLKFQDVVKKSQEMLKKYEIEHKKLKKENQELLVALKKR